MLTLVKYFLVRAVRQGLPARAHGFRRIRGKQEHNRTLRGHAEGLAAIHFIEAAVASWTIDFPSTADVALSKTRFLLGYNWDPLIVPNWAIRVLVGE